MPGVLIVNRFYLKYYRDAKSRTHTYTYIYIHRYIYIPDKMNSDRDVRKIQIKIKKNK